MSCQHSLSNCFSQSLSLHNEIVQNAAKIVTAHFLAKIDLVKDDYISFCPSPPPSVLIDHT